MAKKTIRKQFSLKHLALLLLIIATRNAGAQEYSISPGNDSLHKARLIGVIATEGIVGGGSLAALYSLWYSNYPRSKFHFFNDNNEWRGMDKTGHCMTSYYLGKLGYESLRWTGLPEKKAVWYGGLLGFTYLGVVEIFDGCSAEWGFSSGDLLANSLGTVLFLTQQCQWKEQRLILKWSFHNTDLAKYNPGLLGKNFHQSILKDYNGQTYWLSGNLKSLLQIGSSFPPWLNIAVGYGADGMTGARHNPSIVDGIAIPARERISQFYVAPDIDLTRIPVRSKTLKLILNSLGFIKFPMPTLEIQKSGLKFHYFYF